VAAVLTLSMVSGTRPATAATGEEAVRAAALEAFKAKVPKFKAPAVLRVAFHDAGTFRVASGDGGANASVAFELDRPESFGLKRGLRPIMEARAAMAGTPAEALSLADCIYLAGAYAVEATGGPKLFDIVPIGRVDVQVPDPEGRLPEETLGGAALREHFALSGFSAQELVALSGAHTIGGKGFGDPLTFDNSYYVTLLAKPWADPKASKEDLEMLSHVGLPSDKTLADDEQNREWVEAFAKDDKLFFEFFGKAYLKMSSLGSGVV